MIYIRLRNILTAEEIEKKITLKSREGRLLATGTSLWAFERKSVIFFHLLVSQLLPSFDKLSAICHVRKQSPPPIYKLESADLQYFRQVSPIRI